MRWEAGVAREALRVVDALQALSVRPVRGRNNYMRLENTVLTIAWSLTLDIYRQVVKHVEIFQ